MSNKWKILSVIAVIVLACYYIYPTIMFYSMSDDRRAAMTEDELASLHEKAIKLARKSNIPILATSLGMFDVCGILREQGLKGGM